MSAPEPAASVPRPPRIGSHVGSPGWLLLNHAAVMLHEAYRAVPYLVGSATMTRTWRDVDVRVMVPDGQFTAMFPGIARPLHMNPLWSLHCAGVSLWLRQATGLPVDFQVQSDSHAVDLYGSKPRVPLGIYPRPFQESESA